MLIQTIRRYNLRFTFIILSSLLFNASVIAMDSNIKNALYDITKYEKQFNGVASISKPTANRTLKLLKLTKQRLDGSQNKNSDDWRKANTRLTALISLLKGGTPANKSITKPPQKTTLAPVKKPILAASMISQQRVRVKKIKRDIESAIKTIDQAGAKPFQDSTYVQKLNASYSRYKQSLTMYKLFNQDSDVISAYSSLKAMSNMLAFGQKQAQKDTQGIGDIQAFLKKTDATMHAMKIPAMPQLPLQKGQISSWIDQLSALRKQAVTSYKPLPNIKQNAYLPNNRFTVQSGAPYDMNDVSRIDRGLNETIKKIDGNLVTMQSHLDTNTRLISGLLKQFNAYDPNNTNKRAMQFLGKGRSDFVKQAMQKEYTLAREAAIFAKRLNKKERYANNIKLMKDIENAAKSYAARLKEALQLSRMPKAASTDNSLLSIVKTTLAKQKYGTGKALRTVINTKKKHLSKETTSQKFNDVNVSLSGDITLKGTQTTYHYEWDEFQVATAEAEDNKFYIFYNTLKYYTSGDSTTPIDVWILSKRIQGSQILKENINK